MNERIQELFKQSYGYFPSPIGEPEAEKFAELIIHECMNSVDRSSVCFTADQVRIKQLAISALRKTFQG